jgi:hypothetical protein
VHNTLTSREPCGTVSALILALELYHLLRDVRGAAETHHNLAMALRDLGLLSRAERHVNEAVRLAHQAMDRALLGLTIMGRSELAIARGDWANAQRDAFAARAIAEAACDRHGVAEAHRLQARITLGRRHHRQALEQATLGRTIAAELDAGLLVAECGALQALASRGLGDGGAAERLRREAAEGFRTRGAVHLLRRLEADWAAAGAARDPLGQSH